MNQFKRKLKSANFEFALVNFLICLKKRMPKNLFMTIQKAIKSSKKLKLDAVIKTVIPARKCLTLNIYLRI